MSTWNDRLKEASETIAGAIPEIGFAIKTLIALFWPSSDKDIWDAIEDEVKELVDEEILRFELQERHSELVGLKSTVSQYTNAKIHEKGSLLSTILGECNIVYAQLVGSKNDVHLIQLTIALSYLHLAILRERLLFGKQLYSEDNTKVWEQELSTQLEHYKKFCVDAYLRWQVWRKTKIEVKNYLTHVPMAIPPFFHGEAHGETHDMLTDRKTTYLNDFSLVEYQFQSVTEAVKDMMFNDSNGEFMKGYLASFSLDNFLPGKEPSANPSVSKVEYGPFCTSVIPDGSHGCQSLVSSSTSQKWDAPGIVKSLLVREYNSIDGLQFVYQTHDGALVGDPSGGEAHHISVSGKTVFGITMGFANGIIAEIEISFSDGTSTGKLGNRGGWGLHYVKAGFIPDFQLVTVAMHDGSGPQGTRGIGQISLAFQHISVAPSAP